MEFDWDRCIICQKDTKEILRCPRKAASFDSSVYLTFISNANSFKSLGCAPAEVQLNLENVTPDTLESNNAKWHQSCHLKFSSSKLKKAEERQQRLNDEDPSSSSRKRTRKSLDNEQTNTRRCIICNNEGGDLHKCSSFEIDRTIRRIATALNDFDLLARISGVGDLIAIDAEYHGECFTKLRNRERSEERRKNNEAVWLDGGDRMNESRAFIELKQYISDAVQNNTHFFLLAELHKLYENRLKDFGIEKSVNRYRLKNRILDEFPEAQEQNNGYQTVIVFEDGMRNILKENLKERDYTDDTKVLAQAAKIVRQDIFSYNNGFCFSGAFPPDCQENSVPASLKTLISMLLTGTNLKQQEHKESLPCLTISQTILFNVKKQSSTFERHNREREPPLPIYIGFNIHLLTRCKTLITKMYQLGLSVSYDRVMEIHEWLATSTSQRFHEDGCVAPVSLRKGISSVGALDNIDHNPSSTTASSSFQGTAISIFQFSTERYPSHCRLPLTIPPLGPTSHSLPDSYAIVPLTEFNDKTIAVLARVQGELNGTVEEGKAQENEWLEQSMEILEKEEIATDDKITWAAHHSAKQSVSGDPPVISALLPLFYEKAATPAMIKHGMDMLKRAIHFLNPNQIPVIALDQPLFALAKMVQWKWPATHAS